MYTYKFTHTLILYVISYSITKYIIITKTFRMPVVSYRPILSLICCMSVTLLHIVRDFRFPRQKMKFCGTDLVRAIGLTRVKSVQKFKFRVILNNTLFASL